MFSHSWPTAQPGRPGQSEKDPGLAPDRDLNERKLPVGQEVKRNCPGTFFHFLAGRRFFSLRSLSGARPAFFFTLAGPAWLGCGRTKTTSDGRILAEARPQPGPQPGWAAGGRRLPRTAECWPRPGLARPQEYRFKDSEGTKSEKELIFYYFKI